MVSMRLATVIVVLCVLIGCGPRYAECPPPIDGTFQSPNGAGTLIVENGVRRLKLHGSNNAMGYAYGYLLAGEIIYVMDNLVLPLVLNYRVLRDQMEAVDWDKSYGNELAGMLAGIRDRLGPKDRIIHPHRWGWDRDIDLVDLKIANSISDWACSSFSIWGAGRADKTTLYARNLDYYSGRDEAFKRSHVIIAYDDNQTDHQRWVNIAVCGFIACATGMNAAGMTGALHDTDHFPSSDSSGFIPRAFGLRQALETITDTQTPADVANLFDGFPDYKGTNLHITFPATGRTDNDVAGVLEYDGKTDHVDGRATLRSPSDNPGLPAPYDGYDHSLTCTYALINTNHYVKRRPEADGADSDSGDRYMTIKAMLDEKKADGDVTVEEARQIMAAVGGTGTVHTVVLEPDAMKLHLFLAEPGKAGFDSLQLDYDFEELF